jgi:hypothetical protein
MVSKLTLFSRAESSRSTVGAPTPTVRRAIVGASQPCRMSAFRAKSELGAAASFEAAIAGGE